MQIFNKQDTYIVGIVGDQHLQLQNPRCRLDNYFDAILNKIDYILSQVDIVIGLGDLFSKADAGTEVLHKFQSLLYKWKHKPFYTIFGNHDLIHYNTSKEALKKTSLGNCLLHKQVLHLNKIQVHNIVFKEIPFQKEAPVLKKENRNTVLLGHYFYENNFDKHYSLTTESLFNTEALCICLGHDHEPYPVKVINDTHLLRPGSLCRNTSNKYHLTRIPQYIEFTVTANKVRYEFKDLPDISLDVFNTEAKKIDIPELEKVFCSEIIEGFSFLGLMLEKKSLSQVLDSLTENKEQIDYIKKIHSDLALPF